MDVEPWDALFADRTRLLRGRVAPLRLDYRGEPFAVIEVGTLAGDLPPLPYRADGGPKKLRASVAAGEITVWGWYGMRGVKVTPWNLWGKR